MCNYNEVNKKAADGLVPAGLQVTNGPPQAYH